MRRVPALRRAAGPLAVAALALLLRGGAPHPPPHGAPPVPREPRGVAPQGRLGPEPVERTLETGQGHGWLLLLEAGEFAHVRIEQLGVDVEVALFDPGGRFTIEIDTPTPMGYDGDEHLYLRAGATGLHRLELRGIDDHGAGAVYRARLAARRPATASDLLRVRAATLFQEATALRVSGRLGESLPLLVRSEALFGRLGDRRLEAKARSGRCVAHYRMGDYRKAVAACAAAAAYYRREGPASELAATLNLKGRAELHLDDPWSALESLTRALEIWTALGDPPSLAAVHTDLGMTHRQLSDFRPALHEFGLALALWEQHDEPRQAALVLHERGLLYRKLGRLDQAIGDFRRALGLLARGDDRRPLTVIALALALSEQGADSTALEPLNEALGPLAEALAIEERRGDGGGMARVHTAIGVVQQATGEVAEAIESYRRALPLARAAGDRELVGDLYYNLAWLTGPASVPAISLLERALHEYREAGNREAQITALLALARSERARGQLLAGLQHVETARILFAELRRRLPGMDLKLSFAAHRYGLFDSAIDLLMDLHRQHPDQGWDVRALELSEEARGRGLLDLASGGRSGTADPAAEVLSLGGIRDRVLDPETVLLEYKLGDERSYLWAIEHDRLATFELPARDRLEALARSFHGQLARPPRHAAAAALERTGAELSRALLCPVRDRLQGRRLIVIAEGELLHLPFAALELGACEPARSGPPAPPGSGPPILAAPSASALAALRLRPRPPPARALAVVADPVFDACDPRLDSGHRRRHCDGRFPRLGFSSDEARSILALVPSGDRTAALGFDARRDRIEETIEGARHLHFAVHTDTTAVPPRLVLSRVDRQGRPLRATDLTAEEISQMSLAADLVVLGGCETVAGRRFRGEGLVGLAHSFFAAGAGGVLVTLWPIDDEATAAFMAGFYRRLLVEHLTPAAALALTQHEIASRPRWRSPYYWAAFVLLGEGLPAAPVHGE